MTRITMNVSSIDSGSATMTTSAPAHASQKHEEHEQHQHAPADEGRQHGLDALLDDERSLVEGHDAPGRPAGRCSR